MTTDLLEDYLDIEMFAAKAKRCKRTVKRWTQERGGLPYTMLGNTVMIHVPSARDWMMRRMQNLNPPKGKRAARP
jgi:hypothetical protein